MTMTWISWIVQQGKSEWYFFAIWKVFILCLISKQAFRNAISVQVDLSGMSQLAFRCHRFTWTNILSKRNWLAPKVLSDQRWHCWVENLMYYQVHWFQRRAHLCVKFIWTAGQAPIHTPSLWFFLPRMKLWHIISKLMSMTLFGRIHIHEIMTHHQVRNQDIVNFDVKTLFVRITNHITFRRKCTVSRDISVSFLMKFFWLDG